MDMVSTDYKIISKYACEILCMYKSMVPAVALALIFIFIAFHDSQSLLIPNTFASENCVSYDSKSNLITLTCNSNMTTIYKDIADNNVLKQASKGVWLLNSSIQVNSNATLNISSNDTVWLKLLANYDTPDYIYVHGSINIDKVRITSWDPILNKVIHQNKNGSIPRPYIMIEESNGTMNISNSEIAYIGYNNYPSNGFLYASGGNGSAITNNTFHDMWDGFYSDGVKDITIKNNTYFNNLRYGIDPHTGSHDLKIIGNTVFNNTRIGIICALNCFNILFSNNTVHDNGITGLMFAENTTNSTAMGNYAFNEEVGLSVFASSNNTVSNNHLSSDKVGIFLGGNSSDNYIYKNRLENDPYGFYFSEMPYHNLLKNNDMKNITTAIRTPNDNYTFELDDKPAILELN